MAEERKKKPEPEAPHPGGPAMPEQAFSKAHETYVQALGRSAEATWKWASDTRKQADEELRKLYDDAQKQAADAYATFVKRVSEPPGTETPQQRFQAALSEYSRTLYKVDEDLRQRVVQLHQRMSDKSKVDEVARTWRNEVDAAWRTYLDELRRAWGAVELASMDPETLTRVARSLLATANLRGSLPREAAEPERR